MMTSSKNNLPQKNQANEFAIIIHSETGAYANNATCGVSKETPTQSVEEFFSIEVDTLR